MDEDICWCGSCRRTNWPPEVLDKLKWVGTCSCKGQDMSCFANTDNWEMTCPDCGVSCTPDSAPSIEGNGYGHVTWTCNWAPCGWWWG